MTTVPTNKVIYEYNPNSTNRYQIKFEYDDPSQIYVRYWDETTNEYVYYNRETDWELDGFDTLVWTTQTPLNNPFEIIRGTDITEGYGKHLFSRFIAGSAIKASDLNGNLERLRLKIEENANGIDNNQGQIDDINQELDGLDDVYVNVTGDTMTGPLSMSSNKITTLADPFDPQDAVNLRTLQAYVDNEIGEIDPNSSSYSRFTFVASGGEDQITVPAYISGGELVFINGAEQTRNVDYTPTSEVLITFTEPLRAGDVFNFFCVNTLQIVEVPLGDTSNLPVIRQTFIATADQKTFTLTGGEQYTPGKEQVFLNGSLLERDTDYFGNVGTSFELVQGALAGDQVEIFCVNYTVNGGANTASNVSYTYPGGVQRTVQDRLEDRVSVLDFGADPTGSSDSAGAIRDALAASLSVYVPDGTYRIDSTIKLERSYQTFWTDAKAVLEWRGTSGNFIEITANRPAGEASSLSKSFINFSGFRLSTHSSSSLTNQHMLYVGAGIFHSTISDLVFTEMRGNAPSTNIYFSSNGGTSYSVDIAVRDIEITNGANANLSPVNHGVFIEAGIEHLFERVFVYNANSGFTLGTSNASNVRNVSNCKFNYCQSEMGNRGYLGGVGVDCRALTIRQARECSFNDCKIYAAATGDSLGGDDDTSTQRPLSLEGVPTFANNNIRFNNCSFWGQSVAVSAIKVTPTNCKYRNIVFSNCTFNGFSGELVELLTQQSPQLYFLHPGFTNCGSVYLNYSSEDSVVDGFTLSNARGITINLTPGNDTYQGFMGLPMLCATDEPTIGAMASATNFNGKSSIRFYNRSGASLDFNNGGTIRARVKSLNNMQIFAQASTTVPEVTIASAESNNVDVYVRGVDIGDFVLAGFDNDLKNCNLFSYVTAPNTVRVKFVNRTTSDQTIPSGKLTIQSPLSEIIGTATIVIPGLAANAGHTESSINLEGVSVGDYVYAVPAVNPENVVSTAVVTSNNTISLRLQNESSSSSINLGSTEFILYGFKV